MRFMVLGSLQAIGDDGAIALGSPTQRLVLCALLLERGRSVSADRLIDVVWGESPPPSAPGSLQAHVSRLRKRLGPGSVATTEAGYSLAVDPLTVDADEFETLLARAQRQSGQERLDTVTTALDMWQGDAYDEHRELEAFFLEARRLDELRLSARELRAETLVDLGRLEEAASELQTLSGEYPLREHSVHLHMKALYGLGRHPESLRVFRQFSERLAEMGLEPGPEIRELEMGILTHGEEKPQPSERLHTGNLPSPVSSLIGRQSELVELQRLVASNRLVTVAGPGGIGKTSTAIALARSIAADYPGGAWLCELAPVRDPSAVAHAVVRSLGLGTVAESPEDALVGYLHGQRALLVLDNCEHLGVGVTDLITLLLRECPKVTIAGTSRERLGVAGEQTFVLAPLGRSDDAAERLFIDRASAVRPDYSLSSERDAVASICAQLDGLPLAIEMAAARVRSLSVTEIASRLDERLSLLRSGDRTADQRHQSLRDVVDWSYELLGEPERRMFTQLSVCAGGFTLDAAESIVDSIDRSLVLDTLESLVDSSLVEVLHRSEGTRYTMLETLRRYGAEILGGLENDAATKTRHSAYYIGLAEEAAIGLRGPDELRWANFIDDELGNLRTAHAWALESDNQGLALRLAAAVFPVGYNRAASEFLEWGARLQGRWIEAHPLAGAADVSAAALAVSRGSIEAAQEHANQAIATAPEPPGAETAHAYAVLSDIMLMRGELDAARSAAMQARTIFTSIDDGFGDCQALVNIAVAHGYGGDVGSGLNTLAELQSVASTVGNPTQFAWTAFAEGEVVLDSDPPRAIAALRTAVDLAHTAGATFAAAVAGVSLASLEARHGDPATALQECRLNLELWRALGDLTHQMVLIRNMIVLLPGLGAHHQAAVLHGGVTSAQGAAPYGDELRRWQGLKQLVVDELGVESAEHAIAAGAAFGPAETVDYAFRTIDELASR